MNVTKFIFVTLLGILIISCSNVSNKTPISLFSKSYKLVESKCQISDDCLAQIEGIQCDGYNLIVLDYHSGKSFTLFEIGSGKMIGRYGAIGQGIGEIPLGTYGDIWKDAFYIFYDHTGYIGKYDIDSLYSNMEFHPITLAKYKISNAQISRIMPVNDSVFFGAGTYKSEYQYLLFDNNSNVIDYSTNIYNINDENMNKYHKFLSNQGCLRKHPYLDKFVYFINISSNIDFLEIINSKIEVIKSLRLNNPVYKPINDSKLNRVIPERDNVIGYVDMCTTEHYVYALYSDKKYLIIIREIVLAQK